jgi:hypothetical protein
VNNVVKIRPDAITPAEIAEMAMAHKDSAEAMIVMVMDDNGEWFLQCSEIDVRDLMIAARSLQLEADSNLLED